MQYVTTTLAAKGSVFASPQWVHLLNQTLVNAKDDTSSKFANKSLKRRKKMPAQGSQGSCRVTNKNTLFTQIKGVSSKVQSRDASSRFREEPWLIAETCLQFFICSH